MENDNSVQLFCGVRGLEKDGVAYLHIEDVARGLGFTQIAASGNACVRWERIDRHLSELNFIPISGDGQNPHNYYIPENVFYRLCMKAKNAVAEAFQAKVADEIIPAIRKAGVYATDNFIERTLKDPDWAISVLLTIKHEREQRELAEAQRDEAIRTKAWIGSHREATAMNTASQKSKEVERLREQLGDAEHWKQVKAIRWLSQYFALSKGLYGAIAHKLKEICFENGWERRDIPDTEYGTVKAYPIAAIEILRQRIEADTNMLGKYRLA